VVILIIALTLDSNAAGKPWGVSHPEEYFGMELNPPAPAAR
jgi:hypothetical protein